MEQRLIRRLKNAGLSILAVGLFLFIYNVFVLFAFVKFSNLLLPPLLVSATIGLVFIFLGWKISKDYSLSTKRKLQTVFGLSTLLLILSLASDQTGGLIFYLLAGLLASSLLGLDALKKLSDPVQRMKEVEAGNLKGADKMKDLLKMVLIAIVVIGLFIGIGFVTYHNRRTAPLSSDPLINAVVSRMPKDNKLRADYVIKEGIASLFVKSSRWQTAHNLSFAGFCGSVEVSSLIDEIKKLNIGGSNGFNCTDSDKTLAISSSLNNGKYICGDNTDYKINETSSLHTGLLCGTN